MIDWEKLLGVWLALPFDRALDPATARERAKRYIEAAGIAPQEDWSDLAVSGARSLLAVTPVDWDSPHPPLSGQEFEAIHPLGGTRYRVQLPPCEPERVADVIRSIVKGLDDPAHRTLALWRLLPERLMQLHPGYQFLPPHAKIGYVPVWILLDCVAAVAATGGRRIAAIDIGGVQRFLGSSRTTRDLWSASLLATLLMASALRVQLGLAGPMSVVFPSLRANPSADLLLREKLGDHIPVPDRSRLVVSSLPNSALVVDPSPDDNEGLLPISAHESVEKFIDTVVQQVRASFGEHLRKHLPENLIEGWDRQLGEGVFATLTFVVASLAAQSSEKSGQQGENASGVDSDPVRRAARWWESEHYVPSPSLRRAIETLVTGEPLIDLRDWQDFVHVLTRRVHVIKRADRPLCQRVAGIAAPKCSNCGVGEQVGPVDFDASRSFWEHVANAPALRGVRFNRRDRLCPEDLVKRLLPVLGELEPFRTIGRYSFPDLATIAATDWLEKTRGEPYELDPDRIRDEHGYWSGEWLHWPSADFDPEDVPCPPDVFSRISAARSAIGPAPVYAAIIASDGDDMGRWLEGSAWPAVHEFAIPEVCERLEQAAPGASNEPPCVGPVQQALFSTALSNFATGVVPDLVAQHRGVLVYAGGDDSLVFAPAMRSVRIAADLYKAFRGMLDEDVPTGFVRSRRDGGLLLMPGPRATSSCGIALVHYKEGLRFALAEARAAQKWAKECGRDMLAIAVLRRSGEHTRALCPWQFTPCFESWSVAFAKGASDRWVYRLARVAEAAVAAGVDAFVALLKRELDRSEKSTVDAFGGADAVASAFERYWELMARRGANDLETASGFLNLMLTASFLARPTVRSKETASV